MDTESLIEKLPLPKLEAYFEEGKNKYWLKKSDKTWGPRGTTEARIEMERLGYSTKAPKGKSYSAADYELADLRNERSVIFAGGVAGKKEGIYRMASGEQYLVTNSPRLVEPAEGEWPAIQQLAKRLFRDSKQVELAYGWCQSAVRVLYQESGFRSQLFAMAGPAGCGKSFWQHHVINSILGGRHVSPIQYMTGGTGFNEDIIRSEHLMMEDVTARTDVRARRALGTAIKEFTVNRTLRAHAKGKDALTLESRHWVSLSTNDEAENLSILPPMDSSLQDKILLIKCYQAINRDWPGEGKNEWLEKQIRKEIPAFIHYLLNDHKIPKNLENDRFGVIGWQNEELMAELDRLSPEDGLDYLIDSNWEKLRMEKGKQRGEAADIETALQNNPEQGYRVKRILTWDGACGVYLERLSRKYPHKYIKPKPNERPRIWTVDWSGTPED